jgi:hypothetical protein
VNGTVIYTCRTQPENVKVAFQFSMKMQSSRSGQVTPVTTSKNTRIVTD